MKRIIGLSLLAMLVNLAVNAQAVLPTTWSFSNALLPTGWTQSGTLFYTASTSTNTLPAAMKFDNTGDYLTINFNSNPGNLTYYLAANVSSGTTFSGTFTVEESDFGLVWTTLHAHTSPAAGAYTMFTDVPQSTTRYIRFVFTNKINGNIGLDDVNIAVAPPGPIQEINVKQGATTIVSGGTYLVNSAVATIQQIAI